jgi:signal transduction histidine kinase
MGRRRKDCYDRGDIARLIAEKRLGIMEQITTMQDVRLPLHFLIGLAIVSLAVSGVSRLRAADEGPSLSSEPSVARPALTGITLGGRALPVTLKAQGEDSGTSDYQGLSLLPGDLPLTISLGTAPPGKPSVVQIRTRLEGQENEMQDHDSQMYLILRFLDDKNARIGTASFIRVGKSPGWGGLPQNSRWHRHVEEAIVPERTARVKILLVSGGAPQTTGFWAIRQLRLATLAPGAETPAWTPLFQLNALVGTSLESQRGQPDGWEREGPGASTSRVYSYRKETGDVEPLLALIDTHPQSTGGWLQSSSTAVPVVPGQRLRLETEEMYSIGRGLDAAVSFHALPVGDYVFRAWATDELGRPTGPSLRLPVEVRPPFYSTLWFRLLGAGVGIAVLLTGVQYTEWRKMQRELQRLNQLRAVEAERTRLARDIHDEMGSRFTQISLLAGRALRLAPADEAAREPIQSISGAVKELASALEEIVWAANPAQDLLEGFSNFLSQYSSTVLRNAGLRCRLEIPTLLPAHTLPGGLRHRLMMAVKEALNNTLKHAHATEVVVRLELDGPILRVTVSDNGGGFDPGTVKHGNGLDQSVRRMEEVGGTCVVESRPAGGTQVRLAVPLPAPEVQP